jgi:hypothetical protein
LDEIDIELKRIQLERERLALEREIALRDGIVKAKGVARVAIGAPVGILFAFGRLVRRWWVVGVAAVVLIFVAATAVQMYEKAQKEEREAALRSFINSKCEQLRKNPPSCSIWQPRYLDCSSTLSNCEAAAWREFDGTNPQ